MYLNSSVPSRRKIFDDYNSTNNWREYKRQLIKEFHDLYPRANTTTLLDVPIICRIDEGL